MRLLSVTKLALALTLVAPLVFLPALPGAAAPIGLEALTECSDRAWEKDMAAWPHYAFDRQVIRRSLNADGSVDSRELLRFHITPKTGGGFDEEIFQIDSRQPTEREVNKYRDKEIFTRHSAQADQLELENPLGDNLALMPILQAQEYRILGEDEVNGHACYRAVFDARPAPEDADVRTQLQYAATGSACFTVDGCHTVAFEMETVRPLKEGPLKLDHLQLSFESAPVEEGIWLFNKAELHSDFSVLGKKIRKYNSIRFSKFRPYGK